MKKCGNDWDGILAPEFEKDYYLQLRQFLKQEYAGKRIFPDMYDIFNALKFTPYSQVKAVIVGQDPYINPGEAHGLAFSVKPPTKTPPSLANIFKELQSDLGCEIPADGSLTRWAEQGVLLLNRVLTVQAGRSKSHAGKGWETFTARVLELLEARETPTVFMLWGRDAQRVVINNPKHLVLTAAHPSPLAGGRFFGCRHFSKANEFLCANGRSEIIW